MQSRKSASSKIFKTWNSNSFSVIQWTYNETTSQVLKTETAITPGKQDTTRFRWVWVPAISFLSNSASESKTTKFSFTSLCFMCSSGNTSSLDQLVDKFSSIKISNQNNFKITPPSTTSTSNNDHSNSYTLLKPYQYQIITEILTLSKSLLIHANTYLQLSGVQKK
jgi:cellobiose-specific phosphotransferase system component IIB